MTIQGQTIREMAQQAVRLFSVMSKFDDKFGYDRESLVWVEGFIEERRVRKDITAHETATLVRLIGSYLGECVIQAYGGVWRERDGDWGVFFDDSNAAFPFSKVWKQFENGVDGGDSIVGFFDIIPEILLKKN
jgi:hypothetical protein